MLSPAEDERNALAAFKTVDDILVHHARRRPGSTACFFEGDALSWAELDRRATRIANGLIADGVPLQGRVAYIGKNNSRFFELLAGCARSGRVLAPINWRLATPEFVDLLNDFDVEFLVLDDFLAGQLASIRVGAPRLRRIVMLNAAQDGHPAFDDWRDAWPETEVKVQIDPEDIILQMHTSGTSGRPKGVMHSNRVYLAQARLCQSGDLGDWRQSDVIMVPLPIFHVGGVGYASYGHYLGAETVVSREASPDGVIQTLRQRPVTRMGLVPAIIAMVLDHPDFDRDLVRHLRCLQFGGSPISAELLERAFHAFGCDLWQQFGMTETASIGTWMALRHGEEVEPELLRSVGRAFHNVGLRIVDPEGADLPVGQSGEILIKTPTLMNGYYKRPEATDEVVRDGWYHTGDVGYLNEDGYLFINDRIKDMVITGGENVYSIEVEQALCRHPAVLDAAVIGIPSRKWGEDVMAFVVRRPGHEITEDEVIADCRGRIAHFKCPRHVRFVDVIPRNAVGKALKRVLREPFWKDRPTSV